MRVTIRVLFLVHFGVNDRVGFRVRIGLGFGFGLGLGFG